MAPRWTVVAMRRRTFDVFEIAAAWVTLDDMSKAGITGLDGALTALAAEWDHQVPRVWTPEEAPCCIRSTDGESCDCAMYPY